MAGIPALKTSLRRLARKISPFGPRKISVVRYDGFTGELIDSPSEDNINEKGILLIPEVIQDYDLWEQFCDIPSSEVPEVQGFDKETMTLEVEPLSYRSK